MYSFSSSFIFLLLLLFLASSGASSSSPSHPPRCPSPLFRSSSSFPPNSSHPPISFHFFAVTQDCQFLIARPDQLNQLPLLRVDHSATDCAPSRVQLLWTLAPPGPSLLLLQQRPRQLCLLPVELPRPLTVQGKDLFRYSLMNALRHFAHCTSTNSSAPLDPNLAFSDPLYSDLLYFLHPSSSSSWSILQFHLSPSGHLHFRDSFRVHWPLLNGILPESDKIIPRRVSPILLVPDAVRKRLFAVPRGVGVGQEIRWASPSDLLFRPHLAQLHRIPLFSGQSPFPHISGFNIDRNVAIFSVSELRGPSSSSSSSPSSSSSFLFLSKLHESGADTRCVAKLTYGAKFGVISGHTLDQLEAMGSLPAIGKKGEGTQPTRTTSGKPKGHLISVKGQTAKTTKRPEESAPFRKSTTTTERTMKLETDGGREEQGEEEGEEEQRGEEEGGEEERGGEERRGEEEQGGGEEGGEWSSDYAAEGEDGPIVPLSAGDDQEPAQIRAETTPRGKDQRTKVAKLDVALSRGIRPNLANEMAVVVSLVVLTLPKFVKRFSLGQLSFSFSLIFPLFSQFGPFHFFLILSSIFPLTFLFEIYLQYVFTPKCSFPVLH